MKELRWHTKYTDWSAISDRHGQELAFIRKSGDVWFISFSQDALARAKQKKKFALFDTVHVDASLPTEVHAKMLTGELLALI